MRSERIRLRATCLLLGATAAPVLAAVFSSEFSSDPVSEGWDLVLQYCEPETWNDQGWYHQELDLDACPPGPGGGRDTYRRSLEPFNGAAQFFLEFRVQTDGHRSEIPGGAPTVVALGNSFGVIYHVTVARDLVKFARDVDLPIWFIEIDPGVPHTYRIELYPDRYAFYIDAYLIDEGLPEGTFPAHDSRITWQGRSWYLPCENAWDYIRYGVIPEDGSGDYDTDGAVAQDDFYFFHECLTNVRPGINGGPENDAGPGCRFADFDGDADLRDFAEFQNLFNRPHP
jgi:hypothetical protein